MNSLMTDYRYFFKYFSLESPDLAELRKLIEEEDPVFRPENDDKNNPHHEMKSWIAFQQIIKHNLLYFPHYRTLNDPFECVANIHYIDNIDEADIQKQYELNEEIYKCVAPDITLAVYKELIFENVKAKKKNLYDPSKTGNPLPLSVISLAENPVNIQMWSYYANNHTGACIIFEMDWEIIFNALQLNDSSIKENDLIEALKQEGFPFSIPLEGEPIHFGFQKVQYFYSVPDYQANDFFKAFHDEDEKKKLAWFLARTKHQDWSHEKEWRLTCFNLHSKASDDLMPLSELKFLKPCGIILGCKMSQETKELIKEHYHNKFQIFEASPHIDDETLSYELTPNKATIIKMLIERKEEKLEQL